MRMEVGKVAPAELIAKHEIHVMAFGAAMNREVKETTFEEAARLEAAVDEPLLKKMGVEQYLYLVGYFALPALVGIASGSPAPASRSGPSSGPRVPGENGRATTRSGARSGATR